MTEQPAAFTSMRAFCRHIGSDPLLVQGAGGNVSWKAGDVLWVKASGMWLADAEAQDIFVPVDLAALRRGIETGTFDAVPVKLSDVALRPSIETMLHALMPHAVVAHLHAIEPLARLVREECTHEISRLLGHACKWAIADYRKPGPDLAAGVHQALSETPNADVVFLQGHGVVIGGPDIEAIASLIDILTNRLRCDIVLPGIRHANAVDVPTPATGAMRPIGDPDLHALARDPSLLARVRKEWVMYPDHAVFLGAHAHVFDTIDALLDGVEAHPGIELAFVADTGTYVSNAFSLAKQVQLRCYYDVLIRQAPEQRLQILSDGAIAELLGWDAERYRMSIAK
ncbi:MAG: class II aldolase/adducin family protein [Janthinobacterium lividum]